MLETKKLYNKDPYLSIFNAKILEINELKLILDQTAFYPISGGQSGDQGTINGLSVIDTQIEDNIIKHIIESEPNFKIGLEVECKIDWERRYKTMRLHSASHIMEYFLLEHYGPLERIGSSVDDKKEKSDYLYDGRLLPEDLKIVEDNINNFISGQHQVIVSIDPENPDMRIWKCDELMEYCGGTHIRNTSEIGPIRLKRKNTGKGRERVETYLASN